MASGSIHIALISSALLWGPGVLGQGDPPFAARLLPADAAAGTVQARWVQSRATSEKAARDLAQAYLAAWSEPNAVALASAPSFYGPVVAFHGRIRTLRSVLAEKRFFAELWPHRVYRHLPKTTEVACEADGARCTVRASFDFLAVNPQQGRRSLGIGEHELVVSFTGERPIIVAENSRVVLRSHGNMNSLLENRF